MSNSVVFYAEFCIECCPSHISIGFVIRLPLVVCLLMDI